MRARTWGWAVAVPLVAGCELVLGLGGLGEGSPDATSQDAPSNDAPADVTKAMVSPCAVADAHSFCEDFDEIDATSGLATKWTMSANISTGGIVNTPFVSPPHSLAVQYDALDGGQATEYLRVSLAESSVSSVTCQADLWVDHVDPDPNPSQGATGIVALSFVGNDGVISSTGFGVFMDDTNTLSLVGVTFPVDGGGADFVPPVTLGHGVVGEWMHLTLLVDGW